MMTDADSKINQLPDTTCQLLASGQSLLDAGLVPVEDAAAALGIEPKRLRGFMWRNGIADPIGDQNRVYGWSCRALAAKLAQVSGRETIPD